MRLPKDGHQARCERSRWRSDEEEESGFGKSPRLGRHSIPVEGKSSLASAQLSESS